VRLGIHQLKCPPTNPQVPQSLSLSVNLLLRNDDPPVAVAEVQMVLHLGQDPAVAADRPIAQADRLFQFAFACSVLAYARC